MDKTGQRKLWALQKMWLRNLQTEMNGLSWFWEMRREEAWAKLCANLHIEKRKEFSSDDLRRVIGEENIKRFFRDPQHDIGALFAAKQISGEIERTDKLVRSSIPSNHNREIRVYKLTR